MNVAFPESGLRELALFAGAGGGILGGKLLGWKCVCAVEIDAYCRKVLLARQRDGILEPFPIWDDVKTFDGHQWRGSVDIISGGFPCQDISVSGPKTGITGERSSLWFEMARIIREVLPQFVLVENSPALIHRGLDAVLSELAAVGYDARWGVFSAESQGAPITRERIFIAGAYCFDGQKRMGNQQNWTPSLWAGKDDQCPQFWKEAPPRSFGVVNGVASYMDRVRAIGNGQVPAVVRLAWETLSK